MRVSFLDRSRLFSPLEHYISAKHKRCTPCLSSLESHIACILFSFIATAYRSTPIVRHVCCLLSLISGDRIRDNSRHDDGCTALVLRMRSFQILDSNCRISTICGCVCASQIYVRLYASQNFGSDYMTLSCEDIGG